jgi:CRP-like cAMP-binding protein
VKIIFKNRGDVILMEGEESSDAYIILEGEVEVTKNSRVLATLSENSIFGEIALVDSRPRTATCTAKTPCKLGKVTRENYKQLIKHRPEALNPLLRVITDRMRNLTDFLEDLYKETK